jgi:hypothetical protein
MPGQYLRIVGFGVIAALCLLAAVPLMRRWSVSAP